MRVASLAWSLATAFTIQCLAAPPTQEKGASDLAKDVAKGKFPAIGGEAPEFTEFDGIKVPRMLEIQGDKFKETIKDGYW